MRWKELIIENDVNQNFNSGSLEILLPLYKKRAKSVSFSKFINVFNNNYGHDLGIDIDDKFFMNNLVKLDIIDKVEPNNNEMRIYFKYDDVLRTINDKAKKDNNDEVKDKATDKAKKTIKQEKNPL